MQKVPIVTNNRSLAIALHLAGCRILNIWRVFTPEEASGKSAKDLVCSEQGGKVQIFIEDGDNREKIEAAFDSVEDCEKLELPSVSNEDAAKLAHLVLQLRSQIAKWMRNPACAMVVHETGEKPWVETMATGDKIIHHPGMKTVSANASERITDHLSL